MTSEDVKSAVILLSGGLDSTTCLAIAKSQGFECYTISFDYGQRLHNELAAAKKVSDVLGACEHRVVKLNIGEFGGSALTDRDIDVPHEHTDNIPVTYVPARNTIFLSIALAWAEVLGAQDIFIGAHTLDYSGYPDCRPEYFEAFEKMANLATKAAIEGVHFNIHTPLLQMDKTAIIQKGHELGVDYSLTTSCYDPDPKGRACRRCESCQYRKQGFAQADIPDPTVYS